MECVSSVISASVRGRVKRRIPPAVVAEFSAFHMACTCTLCGEPVLVHPCPPPAWKQLRWGSHWLISAGGRQARPYCPTSVGKSDKFNIDLFAKKKKSYQQIRYRCFGLYFTRRHARCLIALSNLLWCSSSLLSTMWWNIWCLVDIPKYFVVFHKFHVQCCIPYATPVVPCYY